MPARRANRDPLSDERFTPAWVFEGMRLRFDLDPASPGHGAGDHVPATRKLTWRDDGLTSPWEGLVWLNPPFSQTTPWAHRFIEHANGVFLGPFANSQWTHDLLSVADLIWLCRDFAFIGPTHAVKRSSMPLFMAALGQPSISGLANLAAGGHPGTLVRRVVAAQYAQNRIEPL